MADLKEQVKKISGDIANAPFDEWLLKKYLSKKESRVHKILKTLQNNFVTKMLEYELIGGMTTGNFQKRVGKALGEDPLEYTRWSILFGFLMAISKYTYAYFTIGVPVIGFSSSPVEWWSHLMTTVNIYRFFYIKIRKQPISAFYVWIFSLYFWIKDKIKGNC